MAQSKWTPGKIVLVVFGVLFGLGVICCGGLYLVFGPYIRAGLRLKDDFIAMQESAEKEFGAATRISFGQTDRNEPTLLVGVDGDLTADRVREVQDKTWRLFAEKFRVDGSIPIEKLGVGKTLVSKTHNRTDVVDWSANLVSVEELVKRTGVAAPPVNEEIRKLIEKNGGVTINDQEFTLKVGDDKDAEKKKEGGGGEPGPK